MKYDEMILQQCCFYVVVLYM